MVALHLRTPAKRAAAIGGIGVLAAFSAACGNIPPGGSTPIAVDDGASAPADEEAGSVPAASPDGAEREGEQDADTAPDDGLQRCRADQLEADLGRPGAAAGNRYAPLAFTNTADHPCGLRGYPGVTVLDSDREQIGPDADRAPGSPVRLVTLAPGESATAQVHWASAVAGDCRRTSSYLRAYPPGATKALITPAEIRLCGDVFDVQAVR